MKRNYKLKYYGTYPTNDSILLSCAIFKLKKYYRVLDEYVNGLDKLIKTVIEYNYHIIIYFDKSIENDEKFIDIFNKYNKNNHVLFCKYIFYDYLDIEDKTYHKNIFGMYVRLLPIFDKNIKYKCLYISDIDLTDLELSAYVCTGIQKFIDSEYKIAAYYKIGYEYKYNNLFSIPNTSITLLSNIAIKKHYYRIKKIFFNYLFRLNNNDEEIKQIIMDKNVLTTIRLDKLQKFFDMDSKINQKILSDENDLFSYGIDELFTNRYLIPAMDIDKIGIFYIYDSLVRYTHHIVNIESLPSNTLTKMLDKLTKSYNYHIGQHLKYKYYNNIYLNKINYLLVHGIGNNNIEKIINFYKIIKRYIKYMIVLSKKYGKLKYKIWLDNLILHKNKGLYLQIFMANNISDKKFLEKYIKIYSFRKLYDLKNDIDI